MHYYVGGESGDHENNYHTTFHKNLGYSYIFVYIYTHINIMENIHKIQMYIYQIILLLL